MWLFFLLIPPIMSIVWMMLRMKGFKARERQWLVVAIVVLLTFYFAIEKYLTSTAVYPFPCAQLLRDLAATMMVPMLYLMFAFSFGLQKAVHYFNLLVLIASPMLLEVVATVIDVANGTTGTITSTNNYIHVGVSKDWALEMQMFSVIVLVQVVVVLSRVLRMRHVLANRHLHLTETGVAVSRATLALSVWVILSLLPPHAMLMNNHLLDAIILVYSVVVSVIIVVLTNCLNADVIVDNDQRVVSVEDDTDSNLAASIRLLIEKDKVYHNSNLRIEDLAYMISSNRTYVARVCRLKFGKTFTELMNYYRIEEAKELLCSDRTMLMEDIAAECGFSSASFFARVFKNHVGMTPTQWRYMNRVAPPTGLVKNSVKPGIVGEKN